MTTLTIRQVIDRTIVHDMTRRDLKSARNWLIGILVAATIIVGAAVASAVVGMLP